MPFFGEKIRLIFLGLTNPRQITIYPSVCSYSGSSVGPGGLGGPSGPFWSVCQSERRSLIGRRWFVRSRVGQPTVRRSVSSSVILVCLLSVEYIKF